MSTISVLEGDGLGFAYGRQRVIEGVSVELRPGITGLPGPNGAGKTTFMRLAFGLLIPADADPPRVG